MQPKHHGYLIPDSVGSMLYRIPKMDFGFGILSPMHGGGPDMMRFPTSMLKRKMVLNGCT